MVWLISAKRSRYDHASAFAKFGFIDWRQNVTYEVGDIVYIYYGKPTKKVMYKCVVEKCNMSHTDRVYDREYWVDSTDFETRHLYKHARLKLIEQTDSEYLTLECLQRKGLIKNAPQKGQKVSKELEVYLNKYFNDYYTQGFFNDVNQDEQYHEGHVVNAKVNRYERSSIARMKCIEYHGAQCVICGMDFGKRYGKLGEGFIHVHHLKPLHSIGQDYVVDYKKDLIPVCPNCHAMIHRIPDGENMAVEDIRSVLESIEKNDIAIPQKQDDKNIVPIVTHSTMSAAISKESQTAISVDVEDEQIPNIIVGASVKHKIFGLGTVNSIDHTINHIVVSFSIGEKVFILSDCIKKGYLELI